MDHKLAMSAEHCVFFLLLAVTLLSVLAKEVPYTKSCEKFSQGNTFEDEQALGTWYLLQLNPSPPRDQTDPANCVQFSTVDNEERRNLSALISSFGTYQYENLVLKMQIPCPSVQDKRMKEYYLQKIEGKGAYYTLEVGFKGPNSPNSVSQNPIRMKLAQGKYLMMMDCMERFTFVLGRTPLNGEIPDAGLMKLIAEIDLVDN